MDDLLLGMLDLSQRSDEALTRRLTDQLRTLIADGSLQPGQRLPSSRALARSLAISRNTVTRSIEQLATEGYLSVARSRRPVVAGGVSLAKGKQRGETTPVHAARFGLSPWARHLSDTGWPPVYDGRPRAFQPGLADEREFPHDVWGRCLRHAAGSAHRRPDRSHNAVALQEVLLHHVADNRGVRARPEQIIVVPSAQAGIALVAKVMIEAGDVAWMESPGYGGAFAALQAADAEVAGVPTDADGLIISGRKAPRLIFVTPSHQYPTGRLMPVGRRLELLHFAGSTGATIIEDDYDGEFHYEGRPVAALVGLDPSARVIYLGTFSKTMVSDVRVGYLVVPEALVPIFTLAQRHLGMLVSVTSQAALAEFIASGAYLSHVRRMTRLYRSRRDRLVQALAAEASDQLLVDSPAGGMQLLARLDGAVGDAELAERLEQSGVTVRPLSEMLYHKSKERGLFLGFAAWNDAEIDAGAQIIGRCIRRPRQSAGF